MYQFNLNVFLMLCSALFAGMIGVYVWRYRAAPGGLPFAVLLFLAMLWGGISTLEVAAVVPATAIFWAQVDSVIQLPVATAAFCFTLDYAGFGRWLNRWSIMALALPPLIFALLVLTNDAHHLIGTRIEFQHQVIQFHGTVFWIVLGYSLILGLVALLTWLALWVRWRLHRWLTGLIFAVMVSVRIANLLEVANLNPFEPLDLTILAIDLNLIVYFIAIYYFQFFDVIPIARTTALEQTDQGIMILDRQNCMVELNVTAQTLLQLSDKRAIGMRAERALGRWQNLVEQLNSPLPRQIEIEDTDTSRFYDVHILPLANARGFHLGRMLLWHDISDLKRTQAQLVEQQRALAIFQEREQLARELHDSLGQVLGFVKIQAQAARNWLAQSQPTAADEALARLVSVAQDAHSDVREYILGAQFHSELPIGFFAALRQYLERLQKTYGIHVDLRILSELTEQSFEPMVAVQLLRIIQEATANVGKHSRTLEVELSFVIAGSSALITIQDHGIGFDSTQFETVSGLHFGLRFMRERVEQIGGTLQVDSEIGQGTRVRVTVPIKNKVAE